MQSDAKTVDEYMNGVPEERRAALARLREHCQRLLPGFEEKMGYGMPGYVRDGVGEVGFASQKQYISFYIPIDVMQAHREQLAGLSVGKSCIRYRRPEQIDFAVVDSILTSIAESTSSVG